MRIGRVATQPVTRVLPGGDRVAARRGSIRPFAPRGSRRRGEGPRGRGASRGAEGGAADVPGGREGIPGPGRRRSRGEAVRSRGAGRGAGKCRRVGLAAGLDFRRAGAGDQAGLAVPAARSSPSWRMARIGYIPSRRAYRAGELRGRRRPVRGRLGRAAGRRGRGAVERVTQGGGRGVEDGPVNPAEKSTAPAPFGRNSP